MKTSELQGVALDWAVAKCEGHGIGSLDDPWFAPSTDWAQGGPIIEREGLWLQPEIGKEGTAGAWYCVAVEPFDAYGDTPLIAAMRCYVASKLGDEVQIPEELK